MRNSDQMTIGKNGLSRKRPIMLGNEVKFSTSVALVLRGHRPLSATTSAAFDPTRKMLPTLVSRSETLFVYLDYLPAIREILRSDPNLKNRPNSISSRRSRPYHQHIIDLEHDEIEKLQSDFDIS